MKRKWLIELRKKNDLTQDQLAEKCGITQMMIANIESGIRRPSPKTAQKIAEILKFNWTKFYEESKET